MSQPTPTMHCMIPPRAVLARTWADTKKHCPHLHRILYEAGGGAFGPLRDHEELYGKQNNRASVSTLRNGKSTDKKLSLSRNLNWKTTQATINSSPLSYKTSYLKPTQRITQKKRENPTARKPNLTGCPTN